MVDLRGKLLKIKDELSSPDSEASRLKQFGRITKAEVPSYIKDKINSEEYAASLMSETDQAIKLFNKLEIATNKTPEALPKVAKKPSKSGDEKKFLWVQKTIVSVLILKTNLPRCKNLKRVKKLGK